MNRKVTLFTGQWADLPFEEMCKKASEMGYDGLEIACWGDHMDVKEAATNPAYVEEKKAILKKYNLECFALGEHIAGQCVGDIWDKRLDNFAPEHIKGNPEAIRQWGIQEMKYSAHAAKNMGCYCVTGFTGSPIWKFFYSWPQTTEDIIEDGYKEIVDLWSPIFEVFDENSILFALEIHPAEIAFDLYSTNKLMDAFNYRKTLGINFDPSHLIWQGLTPHLLIREFPKKIYHVHMKDAAVTLDGKSGILGSHLTFGDIRRGWNFRSIGHGNVDFESIIRELNAINYEGPLSVEWEDSGMDRHVGARESCEYINNINFSSSTFAFDDAIKR